MQYAISKGNNEIIQLLSPFMVGDFTIEKIQNELLLVDAFRHDDVNKLKQYLTDNNIDLSMHQDKQNYFFDEVIKHCDIKCFTYLIENGYSFQNENFLKFNSKYLYKVF